jgi:hypothetical protein
MDATASACRHRHRHRAFNANRPKRDDHHCSTGRARPHSAHLLKRMEPAFMSTNKTIDREPTEAKLDLSNELRDEDLERVVGGKLYEAASKGTHIPKVVIEMA